MPGASIKFTCLPACSGIGSLLHVETAALSATWEAGRIMWEAKGFFLAPASYCGTNTTLDSCYFLPLSNCTLQNSGLVQSDLDSAPHVSSLQQLKTSPQRVVIMSTSVALDNAKIVPSAALSLLANLNVSNDKLFWWWRAVGAAYIVRPNNRTLSELQTRRRNKLAGQDPQPGCISLYVRHGDKGNEAVVFEDAAYEAALHRLLATDPSLRNEVFLSTEDPVTVQYFSNASSWLSMSHVQMRRK